MSAPSTSARQRRLAALGLFLLVFALYALSGPGRIDMIDGEHRFAVAFDLLRFGRPTADDPALRSLLVAAGRGGHFYALYAPGASLAGLPLAFIGFVYGSIEVARFCFSLTSALFGALTVTLLFAFWLRLGVPLGRALGWTVVVAFATLFWPLSTATFDQSQQALFALVSVWAGTRSRDGARPLVWAAVAGAAAGGLVLFQEAYVALVPLFALGLVAGPVRKLAGDGRRLAVFAAAAALGPLASAAYNWGRFGTVSMSRLFAAQHASVALVGNPLVGVAGLLVSPGKGILFYSPVVVLAALGWRGLARAQPALARAVAGVTLAQLVLIGSLTFWSGEWCWGPRYLVVTLPLFSLALPYARVGRALAGALVALGVVVQLLALSVDHQRYFFARGLPPHFWQERGWHFHHSQLWARPGELASLFAPPPAEARSFLPAPYPESTTYAIFGPRDPADGPSWMRRYRVFWLPRPWPLWMGRTAEPAPVDPNGAIALFSLVALGGLGCLWAALRRRSATAPHAEDRK